MLHLPSKTSRVSKSELSRVSIILKFKFKDLKKQQKINYYGINMEPSWSLEYILPVLAI